MEAKELCEVNATHYQIPSGNGSVNSGRAAVYTEEIFQQGTNSPALHRITQYFSCLYIITLSL